MYFRPNPCSFGPQRQLGFIQSHSFGHFLTMAIVISPTASMQPGVTVPRQRRHCVNAQWLPALDASGGRIRGAGRIFATPFSDTPVQRFPRGYSAGEAAYIIEMSRPLFESQ
jgi:hypothetical protein